MPLNPLDINPQRFPRTRSSIYCFVCDYLGSLRLNIWRQKIASKEFSNDQNKAWAHETRFSWQLVIRMMEIALISQLSTSTFSEAKNWSLDVMFCCVVCNNFFMFFASHSASTFDSLSKRRALFFMSLFCPAYKRWGTTAVTSDVYWGWMRR